MSYQLEVIEKPACLHAREGVMKESVFTDGELTDSMPYAQVTSDG
jgi:hypothetical protein